MFGSKNFKIPFEPNSSSSLSPFSFLFFFFWGYTHQTQIFFPPEVVLFFNFSIYHFTLLQLIQISFFFNSDFVLKRQQSVVVRKGIVKWKFWHTFFTLAN